jgi:acetoin:2,6-dichlorophenolindophenol oxidoreductase subunit alpha
MAAQMNTRRVPGSTGQAKMRKSCNMRVNFFGEGATGEGVLYESLHFAQLKIRPIIFACENSL